MHLRALIVAMVVAAPALAQDAAKPLPAEVQDATELVRRMEERLQALDEAARQRDQALQFLKQQVDAAQTVIDGGQQAEAALRDGAAALSTRLDAAAEERERLNSSLSSGETTIETLTRQLAALTTQLESERTTAGEELASLKAAAESRARDLARLEEQLAALDAALGSERTARSGAEEKVAALAAARDQAQSQAAASGEEVRRLTTEVAGLREELERTRSRLGDEQAATQQRDTEIAVLSAKLKAALESRIEELEHYRSEFFGRLRNALGDRPDMRIVGDRFVFQSEVLFASGSAQLGPEGQAQLRELARSLREVAASIPGDVSWILRVDGHTDRVPIRGAPFRNNWQLSVERALAVVEFLEREGIPPGRLAAAGFGEWQPLDPADDEIAYRRNRRIEFKLTER
jgi:chemotaxis protein MotB